ncbi:hypothetical protein JCM1840_001746 [Sporobolomyces johnsonii]
MNPFSNRFSGFTASPNTPSITSVQGTPTPTSSSTPAANQQAQSFSNDYTPFNPAMPTFPQPQQLQWDSNIPYQGQPHSGIFRRFGLPAAIVSDRDPKFTGNFWRALNAKVGTSLLMSTAAHPQTDGRAEVTNKSVGQILRIFCEDQPDDWASKIVACEFALNSAVAASTGLAPFETVYGFLPTAWPAGDWDQLGNLAADGTVERAQLHALQATDAMIAARVAMVDQENRHRRDEADIFAVGSKVFLSTASLKFPKGVASKFIPRFIGPYTITAASPASSTYSLDLPPHLRVHNKFHASKLRPHFPNDDARFHHRTFSTPPPVVDASDAAEAKYEIEIGVR